MVPLEKVEHRAALQRLPALTLQDRRLCVLEPQLRTTLRKWLLFRSRPRHPEERRGLGTGLQALRHRHLELDLPLFATQRLELMNYLETMIRNGTRSKIILMTRIQVRSTLMRASITTLQQQRLHRVARQRLPEPRRSARSMPALKPSQAQRSGPPMTCVEH